MVELAFEPDVRSRILSEATRLFADRGVSGTSIQAVAAAAGITRPTLVYHFKSKDGLRAAVLESVLEHWRDELPRLMVAATGRGPRLGSLIHALFDFFETRPALARLVLRELLDQPEALEAALRQRLQPWTGLLTEAIRVGQAQGGLRANVDPEAYTVLIISTAIGVVAIGGHAGALVSPEPTKKALRDEVVRLASAGLLTPTTRG